MAFVDLDQFKHINDRYGHDMDDSFIRTIARQMMAALRESDFAARIGGDEFVMVSTGPALSDAAHIGEVVHELQRLLTAMTLCDLHAPEGLLRY